MTAAELQGTVTATPKRSKRTPKPSCVSCYFGKRRLCALALDRPCSTFRPDSPDGLTPPTQPMLLLAARPAPAPVDVEREASQPLIAA